MIATATAPSAHHVPTTSIVRYLAVASIDTGTAQLVTLRTDRGPRGWQVVEADGPTNGISKRPTEQPQGYTTERQALAALRTQLERHAASLLQQTRSTQGLIDWTFTEARRHA